MPSLFILNKEILEHENLIMSDVEMFFDFLKTAGNNQRHLYKNQLLIHKYNKNASACATFNQWQKMGKQIKRGSKGIPIIVPGKYDNSGYLFDKTQIVNTKNEQIRYEFEQDKLFLLEEIAQMKLGNTTDVIDKIAFDFTEDLATKIEISEDIETRNFIRDSYRVAFSKRLNIDLEIKDDYTNIFAKISLPDKIQITSYISKSIAKNIEYLSKNDNKKELEIGEQQTFLADNENTRIEKNLEKGNESNGRGNSINADIIKSGGISERGISGRSGDVHRELSRTKNRGDGPGNFEDIERESLRPDRNDSRPTDLGNSQDNGKLFRGIRPIEATLYERNGRSDGLSDGLISERGTNATSDRERAELQKIREENNGRTLSNDDGRGERPTGENPDLGRKRDILLLLDLEIGQTVYYKNDSYKVEKVDIDDESNNNTLYLQKENYLQPIRFSDEKELFEMISLDRPKLMVGDIVKYKNKDYLIKKFDAIGKDLKTITITDNTSYLGGIISGSEIIRYRRESDLIRLFGIDEKKDEIANFRITDEILPEKLTPSERLNNNMIAISMLKRLEKGDRELDIIAQETLAKYVGWGGLADVFDENKTGQWEIARNFLKENLTAEEYEQAKESTLTAFYTPKVIIDAMYDALSNLGFKNSEILEPSAGIGNFIGNLPEEMEKSNFTAIELDSISGKIAKYLYPEAKIEINGYEKVNLSNNKFDVAIGNIPFGDFKVFDREYDKNNFLIHDYFFAKTIDKVKPGGVIAFITSSGTMDKKDNSIRKYIGERCDFLGAIRLPNATFKGVAGTEVTSDIVFLQKKDSLELKNETWHDLSEDKNGLVYNKYFVDNPNMIIGEMKQVSGPFGSKLTCFLSEDKKLNKELSIAIKNIKSARDITIETGKKAPEEKNINSESVEFDLEKIRNFSYFVKDNKVFQKENNEAVELEKLKKQVDRVSSYLAINNELRNFIYLQKENYSENEIKKSQDKLNELYDDFYKKYDYINSKNNRMIFKDDVNYPLMASIEIIEKDEYKGKADIFYKRTIKKAKVVEKVETSLEALILSVSQKGKVDFEYMGNLTDKNKDQLIDDLKGEIFLDINQFNYSYSNIDIKNDFSYVTKDEYLSGNIRTKISHLDKYIDTLNFRINNENDEFVKENYKNDLSLLEFQKQHLMKTLPEELTASEINVRLGATWIPQEDVEKFVFELLKTPFYYKEGINVSYAEVTGKWNISGKSKDKRNNLAEMQYGTSRINAYEIIENTLNLKDVKIHDSIKDVDGKVKTVLNKKETVLARQKQELIKEEFKNWIFKDFGRRERLEKIYNEKFNSTVNREYDGSNLNFDGMNSQIQLKQHQLNAVARTLYGGNTLLAHVVGAGKTFEMVASAMESKRLGLCNKSLIAVPKHIVGQFGREFMQLYPGANILIASENDFSPQNRKKFIGRIATGDYDAIIIAHSQFEKIPMSKEFQDNHIQEQIDIITEAIENMKYERKSNFTVKQLQATRKNLEVKLRKLNDDFKKDDVITFEELGVDRIYIDEAHNFKNLFLHTKMQNVAGIGQSEALKSSDLFMKCRYIDELTGGKGIIFATGTPISNSMSELYTMQRYLQYDLLQEKNLQHFDAWASTFGETTTSLELSPEGNGYRMKTRFSKFYNLPELMNLFKEVADIQTADMLNLERPVANFHSILIKPTEEQKEILKGIGERADKIRNNDINPTEDNMLKITNDGKKLALDQRLINEMLPDNPDSKVNSCIKNVFEIWKNTRKEKSTQLIFSDLSTPTKKNKEFNLYDDIKEKLVKMGVPEKEIAFIHDADTDKQKKDLFDKVKKGEVRILLGSTQKMGAGTNVQDKLIALHDLDVPWRPSDLEQRAGRIIRKGNENKEVSIYRYVTENTFDSYLWQTIENKQKFISQIMTSKTPVRVAEDIDESVLSYSEIKALATGNPLIKEKMDLDNEVARLKLLEANFNSNLFALEKKINKEYPEEIASITKNIDLIKEDIRLRDNSTTEDFKITVNKVDYTDKKLGAEALLNSLRDIRVTDEKTIGEYRGFKIKASYNNIINQHVFELRGNDKHIGQFSNDEFGNITRLDNVINKLEVKLQSNQDNLSTAKEQLEIAKLQILKPFDKAEELKNKILRLEEVNQMLDDSLENPTNSAKTEEKTKEEPKEKVSIFDKIKENKAKLEKERGDLKKQTNGQELD